MVKGNFAFDKVQRLPGNIGYEKFRLFAYPYLAAATASSATDFVANTDALITVSYTHLTLPTIYSV